jgi:hypothetical protein
MGNKALATTYFDAEVPAKLPVDVMLFYGNSMIDGYSASWLAMYQQSKYCPEGNIAGIFRNGITTLLNRALNMSAVTNSFGAETPAAIDFKEDPATTTPLYIWTLYANGISFITGDQPITFDPREVNGYWYSYMHNLYHTFRKIMLSGMKPTIRLFAFGGQAIDTINHTVQDFLDPMNALVTQLRSEQLAYGGLNIPVIWGRIDGLETGQQGWNMQAAIDACVAANSKVDFYDYFSNYPYSNDGLHPRTNSYRSFGKLCGSFAIHYKTGNALPIATNVTVSGTLKTGQYITAAYTYSDTDGDLEGETEIEVICSTDDQGLTENVIYYGLHIKGAQGYQLSSVHLNKWIAVRVIPIALTGAKTGRAVLSPWVGPVTNP